MRTRAATGVAGLLLASCSTLSNITTTAHVATSTTRPTVTSTSGAGPLSPSQVFAAVSPALAYIETSIGTGSGILMEDAKLLTNAHVVWPYAEARVVFPDGAEVLDAPVVAWDVMADLAVLDVAGPTPCRIRPVSGMASRRA